MVEVFKTNIEQTEHSEILLSKLNELFPYLKINFDLEDCDNILRVEGTTISVEAIQEVLDTEGVEYSLLS